MARVLSSNIVLSEEPASPTLAVEHGAEEAAARHAAFLPQDSPITRALQDLLGSGVRVLDLQPPCKGPAEDPWRTAVDS